MKRKNTQPIGEAITEYVKFLGLEKGLKEYSIIKSWEEIIGTGIARATREIFIKDRILYIKIDSSIIKNELRMIKKGIIKRINDTSGEVIINDLAIY